MAAPDGQWLGYEVMGGHGGGPQTLVARYVTGDDDVVRIEAFAIPDGTQAALIEAILKATDQNERPGILRAEIERDARVRADRAGWPLLGVIEAMDLSDASVHDTAEDA